MEKSREGWTNRGSDGSRVILESYRPLHDTVLKNGIV